MNEQRNISLQGRSLVFSHTVGRAYGERGGNIVDKDGLSCNGRAHIEHYTVRNTDYKVGGFIGRAKMNITSDYGWNVTYMIDGNIIVPNENILYIPNGSHILSVHVSRTVFINPVPPVKFTIEGIMPGFY